VNKWGLPSGVWLLGGVSLLNDVASEAIYPLLPFFLTSVLGATAVSLGIIEGAAEAVSSVLKIVSGRLSDRGRRRKPIVISGYALSGVARPLISIASGWVGVFACRFVDRVGKGIRSAPRDALLADLAEATNRGRIFGFHRAMDHTGAVLGPVLATLFLIGFPDRYRTLFALTAVPGLLTVVLLVWLREPKTDLIPNPQSLITNGPQSLIPGGATRLPAPLVRYLIVLSVFTLGNSADAFLLLRLTDAAGGPQYIPLLWSMLHLVKMMSSAIGGSASDRRGRRPVIALGWTIYALVYAGFAVSQSLSVLVMWFLIYGVYYGCVEGTERALVADFAGPAHKGTAFGVYNAVAGFGALAASVVFGVIWKAVGPSAAFSCGAALALGATALLFVFVPRAEPRTQNQNPRT
jgi:MFS family permease